MQLYILQETERIEMEIYGSRPAPPSRKTHSCFLDDTNVGTGDYHYRVSKQTGVSKILHAFVPISDVGDFIQHDLVGALSRIRSEHVTEKPDEGMMVIDQLTGNIPD